MAVVKGGKKLKKGKKKTTDTTSTKQWCFTGCKNNHKFTKSMVQCHLCQTWCHYKCIDEKESDIIRIWCCKSCRKLPETTMQLCEKIDELNRTDNILLKFANSINQSTSNTQSSYSRVHVQNLSDDKPECNHQVVALLTRNNLEQSRTEQEEHTIMVESTGNHTTGEHTTENHTTGNHTSEDHSTENTPNDPIKHDESDGKHGVVKTCRLKAAGPIKPLHTVYIGGLDYHTSEDALRAHLMDLNVDNIRNVSKLVQNDSDCSAFKVIISADSIKESVYGEAKFPAGVIVKPFRFYNPDNPSYSRNQTTQYRRSPLGARRFTNNTRQQSTAHSTNRQPLLNDPQPVANATNNYNLQPQQQHMPLKNQYHYNQIPDQTNTQQHHNYMQQHNAASQVLSQLHYSSVTVQPTNLTQHGQPLTQTVQPDYRQPQMMSSQHHDQPQQSSRLEYRHSSVTPSHSTNYSYSPPMNMHAQQTIHNNYHRPEVTKRLPYPVTEYNNDRAAQMLPYPINNNISYPSNPQRD